MLFGEKHRELSRWLADAWWSEGLPVCVVGGLPGSGKTEIALQAMDILKRADRTLPAVHFNCIARHGDQVDDFLMMVAQELAADGDLEPLERLKQGDGIEAVAAQILTSRRLIVADEAQHLAGPDGAMSTAMAGLLQRWSHTAGASGRLLLLSNRDFGSARWSERLVFKRLDALGSKDAETFLRATLDSANLSGSVPPNRTTEVIKLLGGNPRAIKLLVSALARESLDDLIGLATEAWEAHDRQISPSLLRDFEKMILERAEERLPELARTFLSRLSVLRQPAERAALEALHLPGSDLGPLRDELIARFMLDLRRNRYEMHPVLRETVRNRLSPSERRAAHLAAGRFHARPFLAKRALGTAERLGARFIEARYHFTQAESEADLDDISRLFEAHYRNQFGPMTPVPSDPEERDERIALLSALLQARGAMGLEYYLARCLFARRQAGDFGRALPHARRATGPQSPEQAWVLRIRLEDLEFGSAHALKVAREAVDVLPGFRSQQIYSVTAELLVAKHEWGEALAFLRRGIETVPPQSNLYALYTAAADILVTLGQREQAVSLLQEGVERSPPLANLYALYTAAAKNLAALGKTGEALKYLRAGIERVPPLSHLGPLYTLGAEILATTGEGELALELLHEGEAKVEPQAGLELLYSAAGQLLADAERHADAVAHLRIGIGRVPPHSRSTLYVLAAQILVASGKSGEAVELLRHGTAALPAQTRAPLAKALDDLRGGATAPRSQRPFGAVLAPAEPVRKVNAEPQTSTAPRPAVNAGQLLTAMRPDRWRGLYVLGCYDKKKTVYTQQSRALTLVRALFEQTELRPGSRLAVVGGGAAGVMAAAGAAIKGAKVVLYERADHLLSLQRQNTKRYLHPHLFDWPAPGSLDPVAGLPLLDWRADYSDRVALEIDAGFRRIVGETGNIALRLGSTVQEIEQVPSSGEAAQVRIVGEEGGINEVFDVVILATGFGIEPRTRLGIDSPAYWEDDSLNQALGASPSRPERILVSGNGDGALIDLLRATTLDFRHDRVGAMLPLGDSLGQLTEAVRDIDFQIRRRASLGDPSALNLREMHAQIAIPQEFRDKVAGLVRKDTEVWFNFDSLNRYATGSSSLHRVLISLLIELGAIRPKMARLGDGSIIRLESGAFAVTFRGGEPPQIFDRVVLRHGPPADYLTQLFPQLQLPCAPLRGKLRELELTGQLDDETHAYFAAET